MQLLEIKSDHLLYAFVEDLLLNSFPPDERRDADIQRVKVDSDVRMHCCVAVDDSMRPLGFMTYWDLGDFYYGEHFAVDPSMRNCGTGSRFLDVLLSMFSKPIVLEVERPTDDLARRRIGFYRRHGMRLWNEIDYFQPAYRLGGRQLPMYLMSTSGMTTVGQVKAAAAIIHKEIYNVCIDR